MRVLGVAARCGVLVVVEQFPQFPLSVGVRGLEVENLRDRAPAAPAREDRLFLAGGRALFGFQPTQQTKRGEVGLDAGLGAGGSEIVLAAGPERD